MLQKALLPPLPSSPGSTVEASGPVMQQQTVNNAKVQAANSERFATLIPLTLGPGSVCVKRKRRNQVGGDPSPEGDQEYPGNRQTGRKPTPRGEGLTEEDRINTEPGVGKLRFSISQAQEAHTWFPITDHRWTLRAFLLRWWLPLGLQRLPRLLDSLICGLCSP